MPAAERVLLRLDPLLKEHSTLSLGVARDQLVIEGVATDPKNPVLADLAGRLHRHELGAISFRRGIDPAQLHSMLTTLAIEADRTGQPLGRGPSANLTQWSGITLHSVDYQSLQMLGDDGEEGVSDTDREGRTQAAALWIGLARAALAMEEAQGDEQPNTDPSVVAEAIQKNAGSSAYDQVIVGYLLKIADELRTKKGGEALALKNRMSKLVQQLDQTTIQRLLVMGGDRSQRRQFLLSATEGMAVDAVLDLVKAASEAQGQTISHSLLRMLSKMAQHAESGSDQRRALADSAMREQVARLIEGWSLTDPNPDAYGQALQRMSVAGPLMKVSAEAKFQPEPRRMLEMALEVGVMGEGVERAVHDLIDQGHIRYVVTSLSKADVPAVTEPLWQVLGGDVTLHHILAAEPIDADVLKAVVRQVGSAAIEPMLDVLAESESTQTRRVLIDEVAGMGPEVAPAVLRRLDDPRWFVKRNMLAILRQLPEVPKDLDLAGMLGDQDVRVRRQALEYALNIPSARERAMAAALADSDDLIVRTGLKAAEAGCPAAVLPLVVRIAIDGSTQEQRVGAVRALEGSQLKAAREALLRIVTPRRSLFGGWKLPPKTRAFVAALRALRGHRSDPKVQRILNIAARSRDPEIAAAAKGGEKED